MRNSTKSASRTLGQLKPGAPEDAIAYLLKSLHHSLRQVIDEAFRREKIGMSFAHLATMFVLASERGLAGAEIARRTFVTAQTMNTILRRLERDGQIERTPHPQRSRADSWVLTPRGERELQLARRVGQGIWRDMLSALSPAEVAQLEDLLQRCITGLDAQARGAERPAKATRAKSASPRRGRKPAER